MRSHGRQKSESSSFGMNRNCTITLKATPQKSQISTKEKKRERERGGRKKQSDRERGGRRKQSDRERRKKEKKSDKGPVERETYLTNIGKNEFAIVRLEISDIAIVKEACAESNVRHALVLHLVQVVDDSHADGMKAVGNNDLDRRRKQRRDGLVVASLELRVRCVRELRVTQ